MMGNRWWLIIPILFGLASINGIVQPARQAAIPSLVPPSQVGKANAIVAATTMLAGAIGFALAGGILAVFQMTSPLFIFDAATFALAAAICIGIPSLCGGELLSSVSAALAPTCRIRPLMP